MQRLVGSVLNSYMSSFVKNYSSDNFQNWELKNLGINLFLIHLNCMLTRPNLSFLIAEFKEEVVQDLLNVPPNLDVKQVKCSSLSVSVCVFVIAAGLKSPKTYLVQIPWSSLQTKPVIFYLGRIDIVLAEPSELRAVVQKPKEAAYEYAQHTSI